MCTAQKSEPTRIDAEGQRYIATCHCKKVVVGLHMRVDRIWLCNCTICAMRGGHWVYLPEKDLQIMSGHGYLQAYLYNTRTCKNMFCSNCGIHVYAHARSLPGHCAIKIECIENFPMKLLNELLVDMGGADWKTGQSSVREAEQYQ